MKGKEIKQKLKSEVINAEIPDVLAEIKQSDLSKDRQDFSPKQDKKFRYKLLIPLAAALAIILVFSFIVLPDIVYSAPASVKIEFGVTLELLVDKNDAVTGYGESDNSSSLVDKAEMTNKPLDEVIEEIIAKAKAKGYLSEDETEITVEVMCSNRKRKNALQQKVEGSINQSCQKHGACAKIKARGGR